jgi:hypothetical protein
VQAPKKPPAKRPKFIWVALGVCCIGIAAMVISSSKTNTSARSTSALSKSAGDPKKTAMVEPEAVVNGAEEEPSTPVQVEPISDESQVFTFKGKLVGWKHETKHPNTLRFDLLGYKDDGSGKMRFPSAGDAIKGINLEGFVDTYVRVSFRGCYDDTGNKIYTEKILDIEELEAAELKAYLADIEKQSTRVFDPSPNALAFSGTWGPRMSIPSAMQPDELKHFKVGEFAAQISQLTTASYVMVNVTQPAHGNFFTGPHPELAESLKLAKPVFPTRDVLGEVLEAIANANKKALVYFAAEGFHAHGNGSSRAPWDRHVKSLGMTHDDATGELLVGYYAKRYKTKIHGWWFDGSGALDSQERLAWRKLVRAENPKAIVVFNRMAGPPFRSTAQCDFFGGHPTPRSVHKFWDMVNLPMIEALEAGAWMDPQGNPVEQPGSGALGHVFMGMQDRWNFGKCAFPPDQAVDWTTRVLAAGGMYTWHAPRSGSAMARQQFKLLLKINNAVERARGDQGTIKQK